MLVTSIFFFSRNVFFIFISVTDHTTQPGSEGSVICLTVYFLLKPDLRKRLFIVVEFLYIPVLVYRSFSSLLQAICMSGAVVLEESIFMNFRYGYINARLSREEIDEKQEKREKKRKRQKEREKL